MTNRREDVRVGRDVGRVTLVASYVVLSAALLWSRLADLGHSFWFDELYFVAHFVRAGPGEILAGPNLSHELYGVLAWAVSLVTGESEIAYRLLSAVPFVAGVALVTGWLHRRLSPLAGVLYLFLATVSPLLLDISRQARGYGLAYLAMSVLIVAALEASRTGTALPVAVMCAAGLVGTWTLPQFGIAFFATGGVLLADRNLRRPALFGLVASGLAILVWYAPHLGGVRAASQAEAGFRISTAWLLTAPIDQVLIPSLIWIEGVALIAGVIWLPLVVLAVIVMATSPLLRDRQTALVLGSGLVATIVVLWLAQTHIFTRYLSYLLVPSFILVASGAASTFLRKPGQRPAIVRSLICVVAMVILGARFLTIAPDVVRLPREANRDAARVIQQRSARNTPVFVYTWLPEGLAFYLDRPVQALWTPTVVRHVCSAREPVVYVTQPMAIRLVDVPCLARRGVKHYRLRQYARGGEINVWFVPPES